MLDKVKQQTPAIGWMSTGSSWKPLWDIFGIQLVYFNKIKTLHDPFQYTTCRTNEIRRLFLLVQWLCSNAWWMQLHWLQWKRGVEAAALQMVWVGWVNSAASQFQRPHEGHGHDWFDYIELMTIQMRRCTFSNRWLNEKKMFLNNVVQTGYSATSLCTNIERYRLYRHSKWIILL